MLIVDDIPRSTRRGLLHLVLHVFWDCYCCKTGCTLSWLLVWEEQEHMAWLILQQHDGTATRTQRPGCIQAECTCAVLQSPATLWLIFLSHPSQLVIVGQCCQYIIVSMAAKTATLSVRVRVVAVAVRICRTPPVGMQPQPAAAGTTLVAAAALQQQQQH